MGRDDIQDGGQPGWCQRTMLKNSFYFFTCFYQAFKISNERKCILCGAGKFWSPWNSRWEHKVYLTFPSLQTNHTLSKKFQRDSRFSRNFSYSEFLINIWNVFTISWIVLQYLRQAETNKVFLKKIWLGGACFGEKQSRNTQRLSLPIKN